jgi:hypothetical protein
MEKGDLVKLSIRGAVSLCMGQYKDPDMYGTGVFLGWVCEKTDVAHIYWFGGYGQTAVHRDFFEKIT